MLHAKLVHVKTDITERIWPTREINGLSKQASKCAVDMAEVS